MDNVLKISLSTVTFMIIATQTVHSWYVIENFSRIKIKWLRNFQSIMFCSIISIFILVMVFMKEHEAAAGGAAFEALLNVYYYFQDFWKGGFKHGKGTRPRRQSITRFWRQNWFKMMLAFVIPGLIYLCSYYMTKL